MLQALTKPWMVAIVALVLLFVTAVSAGTTSAAVNIERYTKCGANVAEDCDAKGAANVSAGKTTLNNTIETIINLFSFVVGVVAVIMLIYGGFRYVTSGGDSGNISSAKNTILYAIVGLVIVVIAQAIVQFVLGEVA